MASETVPSPVVPNRTPTREGIGVFNRTRERATSWFIPLALLAVLVVSGVAGVTTSVLGGWS